MNQTKRKNSFKILSIDGGGIKGLYSSTILEHFEEKFNVRISDYFDMLCGTSTGGLIALGLSLKIPANEISNIYIQDGQKIFPKTGKKAGFIKQALLKGKFKEKPLKESLQKMFENKKLGESNNLLCIPTYSITDARPWVFKFDHTILGRDNKALYTDVALATSAAPTFFPMSEIDYYDHKQFIDGGVWANNPTLVGLIEALTYFVGKDKDYDSIEILSLSSLNRTGGKPVGLKRERSFRHWRTDLFDTFTSGQSDFAHYFMSKICSDFTIPVNYVRIPSAPISSEQEPHIQMDIATPESIKLIRGKGNDQGEIYKKRQEVADFFKTEKTFKTK